MTEHEFMLLVFIISCVCCIVGPLLAWGVLNDYLGPDGLAFFGLGMFFCGLLMVLSIGGAWVFHDETVTHTIREPHCQGR